MVRLIKKFRRDLLKNKLNTLAVFFVVLIGVMIYTSLSSYVNHLEKYINENNHEYRLPDLQVNGNYFDEEDLNSIKELEQVSNASLQSVLYGELDEKERKSIQLNFIDERGVSDFQVVRGEEFDVLNTGLWLDIHFARQNNIRVGDTINILVQDREIEEEVVGLIRSSLHLYYNGPSSLFIPDYHYYGFVYLSNYHYEELNHNVIFIHLYSYHDADEVKTELLTRNNVTSVYRQSEFPTVIMTREVLHYYQLFTNLFIVLFIISTILLVVRTMQKNMRKERSQIALLKSLGINNRKLALFYSMYIFVIVLLASIAGVISGKYFSSIYHNITLRILRISRFDIPFNKDNIPILVIFVLILTLLSYIICKKYIEKRTVYLLSSKFLVARNKKLKFSFDYPVLSKFSVFFKWRLRSILINKKISITLLLGLILSFTTIISSFLLINSNYHLLTWQYQQLYNFEYRLELSSDIDEDRINSLTEQYGNNLSQTMEVRMENSDENISLFIDSTNNLIRFTNQDKELITLSDDGIYVTEKLAREKNIRVKDQIDLYIPSLSDVKSMEVVGINKNPTIQGFMMTREYLNTLEIEFNADTLYTNRSLSELNELTGVSTITSRNFLRQERLNRIDQETVSLIGIIVMATILFMVIMYHIGVFFYLEKEESFSKLKLYGFQTESIRDVFGKIVNWFTLFTIIISIPLSYLVTKLIIGSKSSQGYDLVVTSSIWIYIVSILIILITTKIIALIFSNKIKTKNMIKQLKIR